MTIREIEQVLTSEPFVPLRLMKTDGKAIDIPYRHVAVLVRGGLLVFKGVKSATSHSAKGYDVIAYDRILDIVPKRGGRSSRKKKAS